MTTLRFAACSLMLVAALVASFGVGAQSDDKSAQKAARRAQLQLQNLQQQVQDAQAAQAKADADKAALDKQLAEQAQQTARLDGALRNASSSLKASDAARAQLAARVAALEKQLAEQKLNNDDSMAKKARELAQFTRLRDEQQAQLQRRHDDQATQLAQCTSKNGKLVQLSAELLDRYRKKGLGDVLAQREPLLGLGDVALFNLVQDYRDRADAERFVPLNRPADSSPSPAPLSNR